MTFAKTLWDAWKRIARIIGTFQTRVILTVFYFVFLLPFGIVFSTKKKNPPTGWTSKMSHQNSLEELQQQ